MSAKAKAAPSQVESVPFKPHRKLLIILSICFAAWVGFLITLYVTTVYPMRHGGHPTTETQEIEGNGR